jgi:hypothetical protein
MLSATGVVSVEGQTVRFTRSGLVEEYTVSMDGVKQDFLVLERPGESRVRARQLGGRLGEAALPGLDAELRLGLAVTGAQVEQTAYGAQLVLEQSGRKIAYSRLKVTDATGKELPAWMEVADKSEIRNQKSKIVLVMVVADTDAVYPVRIDPTFSDANWISLGGIPGANGVVYASAVDDSGNLYIAGNFTLVGEVMATNIAKWNGNAWSALGSGLSGLVSGVYPPGAYALAIQGSNVYAAGNFTTAGGSAANSIAKWDGSTWSALGSGMDGLVHALAVSGSDLYAAGGFANAGGIAATNIAKWDGSAWNSLRSGVDNIVFALAVSGSNVYVGGQFETAGGTPANCIATWDGTAWSAVGSRWYNVVFALAFSGGNLYAGGEFSGVEKWDGSAWTTLGSGMNSTILALAASGSDVYAGGQFTTAGGIAANYVARWDGSNWNALGSGLDHGAAMLTVSGSNVYTGGYFTTAGNRPANYIAQWNGNTWSALGSGLGGGNTSVSSLAVSGTDIYMGGSFVLAAGSSVATNIAKWNGTTWSALGSGVGVVDANPTAVRALAVSGSNLYAAGSFTNAGGIAAVNIAKWDGTNWTALGSGITTAYGNPPAVYALAVSGSDVYAGGFFDTAGGVAVNGIAKWDGTAWSGLGSGLGNGSNYYPTVLALAVSGSNLYVGGWFETAGGNQATNIAKWDGTAWSAMGPGLGGYCFCPSGPAVYALAVTGSDVYAGGLFAVGNTGPAFYVAKWDGSTWNALGSGMGLGWGPSVNALAISGSDLYAAGGFAMAGGIPANSIAKWDGNAWSALGSGLNGPVSALAISGSDLYVGGIFTAAGGKISAYVAKAIIAPFYFTTTNSSVGLSNGEFYFTLVGPAGSNAVVFASTNLQTWTPLGTNPLAGGSLNFTDTFATNFTRRFYRALLQP